MLGGPFRLFLAAFHEDGFGWQRKRGHCLLVFQCLGVKVASLAFGWHAIDLFLGTWARGRNRSKLTSKFTTSSCGGCIQCEAIRDPSHDRNHDQLQLYIDVCLVYRDVLDIFPACFACRNIPWSHCLCCDRWSGAVEPESCHHDYFVRPYHWAFINCFYLRTFHHRVPDLGWNYPLVASSWAHGSLPPTVCCAFYKERNLCFKSLCYFGWVCLREHVSGRRNAFVGGLQRSLESAKYLQPRYGWASGASGAVEQLYFCYVHFNCMVSFQ